MKKSVITAVAGLVFCGALSQNAHAAATAFVTSPNGHKILAVDLETDTVSGTIDTAADVSPLNLAALPDGTNLLVTANDVDSGFTLPVDSTAGTIGTSIQDGAFIFDIGIASDGSVVVVTDQTAEKIFLIHSDGSVIRTVNLTEQAGRVAVSPDGTKAYVSSNNPGIAGNVQVIDLVGTADTAIPVGLGAGGIVFSPDGTKAYVVNSGDETVSVIDTATNSVDTTYDVGDTAVTEFPRDLDISPDGKTLYIITHFEPSKLLVVNAADGADLGPIEGFHDAASVDVDDNGNVAVVANAGGTLLGIADLATKTVTELDVGVAQVGVLVVGGVGTPSGGTAGTTGGATAGTTGGSSGSGGGCSLIR